MEAISILGGNSLRGETTIQGSKNAVLPILAATVLIAGKTILHNCPTITDVDHMIKLLEYMGCKIARNDHTIIVDATIINNTDLPEAYVTRMRSSVVLMGALIGRIGEVSIGYPGGCTIGDRPIDMHVKSLEQLGAKFLWKDNKLCVKDVSVHGNVIALPFPSVGATENIILAAVCGNGETKVHNCATEPEIQLLCKFLKKAGANIGGIGSKQLWIQGKTDFKEVEFTIESDRIVAGTYMMAAIATKGDVFLREAPGQQMDAVIAVGKQMGAMIQIDKNGIRVTQNREISPISYMETEEYPGFPTDLQSPVMAALACANGSSRIKEKIFPKRFETAHELKKMQANIVVNDAEANIKGVKQLYGTAVEARDLRGGAALVIAGVVANGNTEICNMHYIERGYENICGDFKNLGANIR